MVHNTMIAGATTVFLYLWFPTFGPGDIISFSLMAHLGMEAYILYSIIILAVAYNILEGKGIKGKLKTIISEMKALIKSI